jgi:hypothetical protein
VTSFRASRVLGLTAVISFLGGCALNNEQSFCEDVPSVAGFVIRMSQGLDNFSEDQYSLLQSTSLSVYDTVSEAIADTEFSLAAETLSLNLQRFNKAMDDVFWDVTLAVNNSDALAASSVFTDPQMLKEANNVESFVIEKCGLPEFTPNDENFFGTLPMPYIAPPTATEPPTGPVNQESEDIALGTMVGNLFGLTLNAEEVSCIGRELQDIVDVTSATSNADQYVQQYQQAFDTCEIDFQVPTE